MLQLVGISKSYATADFTQTALDEVSISFRDNEFVAILGPSGSGKTTMLNIVGGLDHYDSGDLIIDGISTKKYKDKDWDAYRNNRIGFVFQSYNLIPHQTVLTNVELALTLSGVSRSERKRKAKEALEAVGLGEHVNKRPSQLSGGQMQRVAVARALINDPEILLADEPTGALDSATSLQIMGLLSEIAQDRLVIMVTHNPELAETYATRTVKLRDGVIQDDSNHYEPNIEEDHADKKSTRYTSMSFLTALSLSFNNLMTKKGRTLMTAFAGSIGIIGIAAILALANGVNDYIKNVEEETLTVYPLSIESTGFDMASMVTGSMEASEKDANSEDDASLEDGPFEGLSPDKPGSSDEPVLKESKMLSSMFSRIESNDLASLKEYIDGGESGIQEYANLVSYGYGVTPLIYDSNTEKSVRQINPNTAFSALSGNSALSGAIGQYAAMMTSGSQSNIFTKMLDNPSLLSGQYDVVAGHWPENYDELVLVLNQAGGVSDLALYTMGLRDPDELDEMVSRFASNENVDVSLEEMDLSPEDILGLEFKLLNPADLYEEDEEYDVWKDKSGDTDFMRGLVDQAETIKIVGIVAPNPDSSASSLLPGLCYLSDLEEHLIAEAGKTQIVKEQLANPDVNVFSGRSFTDERENPDSNHLNFESMFTIDGDAITAAFSFDPSAIQVDASGLSNLSFDASSIEAPSEFSIEDLVSGVEIEDPSEQVNTLISSIMSGFLAYIQDLTAVDPSIISDPERFSQAASDYFASQEVQDQIQAAASQWSDDSNLVDQVQQNLQGYMQESMQNFMSSFAYSMQEQISSAMSTTLDQLSANMAGAMNIDEEAFKEAFQFNLDEKELQELMTSMMRQSETSYDSNLTKLGYAELSKPASINIYPKDFVSKGHIVDILDAYNDRMETEGQEDKVIVYTDIVGTLMSSVTDIVNMISYVLVAFVAISLVVSSIMIGIITYISVLERKKEIGILRSIGASKGDVGRVFNAETIIIGFVAGLIGVGLTALAIIPVNAILYTMFGVANLAKLPLKAAIILIAISVFLSFIAGLIPSSAASRKDPVEALRSE